MSGTIHGPPGYRVYMSVRLVQLLAPTAFRTFRLSPTPPPRPPKRLRNGPLSAARKRGLGGANGQRRRLCIITVVPHWSRRRLTRPNGHRPPPPSPSETDLPPAAGPAMVERQLVHFVRVAVECTRYAYARLTLVTTVRVPGLTQDLTARQDPPVSSLCLHIDENGTRKNDSTALV